MADSGGLQLIPQTKKKVEIHRPGQNRLIIIGVIVLGVFMAAGFVVLQYKNSVTSKIEEVDSRISQLETESRGLSDEKQKIRVLASQLKVASQLINNHILWTKGFAIIEARIRPDVQVVSMNVDAEDDIVNFKAKTGSYANVAREIASLLKEPAITDIDVSKITSSPGGKVEFEVIMAFDDKLFIKSIPSVTPRP